MTHTRTVPPVKPVAPYLGGKHNIVKHLLPLIDAVPHTCYAEVFLGLGGVFLRRTTIPKSEVINDLSRDVSTLFRVVQRHYVAFVEMMRFQITTRAEFERLSNTDPSTLTDLERATRFLYLQRTAFGGMIRSRSMPARPNHRAKFDVTQIIPMLDELHGRLSGVVIESLPYDEFIRRYDRKTTLFYLDPPYWACENYYGKGLFERADFDRLSGILRTLKGRFIMSINYRPEVRKTFAEFDLTPIKVRYTNSPKPKDQQFGELIITGP